MARRRRAGRPDPGPLETRRVAEALKAEVLRGDRLYRRRYIREFQHEFSGHERVVTYEHLLLDCWKSGIVYVGDYHPLPASQAFARRLLTDLAGRSRNLVLAVEVFRSRHQAILDEWLSGRIPEREFLRRVRYKQDWGYPWEGFRDLIAAAEELGVPVAAMDCDPRRGLRLIRKRDRTIAARITSMFQEDPGRRILVHIGESHLASRHLPGMVREALHSVGMEKRDVVVVQNSDEIYWDLVGKGIDYFEVVEVAPRRYCAFTATPLEKYEAYRQVQESWDRPSGEDERDFQPVVYGIIDSILGFLGVDKYTWCLSEEGICLEFLVDSYPEVYGPHRVSEVADILSGLPVGRVQAVSERLALRGCCYNVESNSIFVSRFRLAEAAEEAADYVHAALSFRLRLAPRQGGPDDLAFFDRVLQSARGFLGSKIVQPGRDFRDESVLREGPRRAATGKAARFVEGYREFAKTFRAGQPPPGGLFTGMYAGGPAFSVAAREIGCDLAQRLWDAYRVARVRRREIRDLFTDPLAAADAAFGRTMDLETRLREP